MSMTNVRRKYSWWWDSHICPKNSKWLKENLADMDSKIKLMIKIIEEDAESFAQKAEMYYRRRPELMTLLEELYRAYRALAERYDHAAGELRLAHRKIAEAFPDQVLLDLDDDLPAETASIETDTDNSDMTPFVLSFINAGDSNKRVRDDQELQKEISRLSQENQELKKKISSVLEQSDKAESEVLSLKEALAQQEVEKKAAILQCQQSGARLLNLKSEILQTQEEFKTLKKEMQTSRQQPLSAAEEQCLLLERANKDLHLELDKLKRASEEQHVELEKLSISLQEEKLKSMQAEMARLPLEKQLAQEQEKLRHLALEKHSEANKLKDIETSEVRLQKELEKIQEENHKLDGQNRSSTAVIIHLQDEIISLKNAQRRLEEEVSRHVKEKMALGDELSHLKEDRSNLERNHFSIKEQIQVVNFNVESLQALAQEVRDGNVELKEIIKNHEELKVLHLENLRQLEMMSEKNAHLEKSLLDATAKLEGLQENKVALEESCKYLSSKISSHQSERSTPVAQIEAISQSMEKLLEKNVFLENSLSDANAELEGLRRKLKELEESSKALHNQNFVLRSEKRTLISKVDSISDTLLNLETQYAELEWRNSDLQHEKNSVLDEVIKLQELIRKEREEHKELSHSSNTQFGALQKQIRLLVEEGQHREKQLEKVEHQIGKAQIEIFILHRCLCDMAEVNSDLTAQLQKHQEVCKVQEEQLGHLSQHNQTLTKWISSIVEVLHLDRMYESLDQMNLDIVVQLILHEIKCLLNTISDAQDVKQKQLLEKSLVVTLLEHFGQEIADLRSERNSLKQEWQAKSEELLQLQSERHDLLKISDNFWNGVEARNHKVEELKAEAKFLGGQLSELQVFRRSLEGEIVKLIEENSSLSNKLYNFMEKEMMFEDDFSTLLGEAVSTDILGVIFRSLHEERTLQLQSLQNEFASLHIAGNELYQEIRMMNKKFGDLELENDYLKKDPNRTMSICDRSGAGLDTGKRSNIQQGCGINMEQHEVGCCVLEKSNDTLWEELQMLQSDLEVLRAKERAVIDVKSCDAEITKLLTNMQMAIMNAALFKEKVLELIITYESFEISAMVEKEVLKEEITRRNSYVDKLKDKLNAVEIENRRLKVDLNGDFTLLGSLQTEVNALERETLSLAKDCLPSNNRTQENALSPQLSKIIVYPIDDQNAVKMVKDMELHKLHGTIKALQKVVMDTGVLLEKERLDFNGNLQEARKQIEMLKLKDILDDDLSEINYEQMLKDIQLDLMQTSSGCITDSFQQKESKNAAQANNKMLRYRGMVRENDDNLRQDDLRPPQSEALERDNGKQSSSEPMVVKELSIDMQELPRSAATEPHQEWKKTVIERLSSDAQRLAVLQSGIQELKTAIEAPDEFELESLKAQIREAEATISQLIDTNGKLSEKAEEFASTDELDGENIDLRSRSQRKILERARKMSEKIGRLELEMQKVQKALLKHEEENASRHTPKDMQRRSRVQLMQYLYGRRRDSQRQKRGSSCCCMRAKTIDD